MDMGSNMVQEEKERVTRLIELMEPKPRVIILLMNHKRQGSYFPTRSTGNGQGGNGGDEDRNDKKKYRDTEISFENVSHEESDTEDSYELQITPQQLSQVTPGGGALKIKLSKKKTY